MRNGRVRIAALCAVAVLVLSACSAKSASWTVQPVSGVSVAHEKGLQPTLTEIAGLKLPTKLVIKDAVVGSGPEVTAKSTVYVAYIAFVMENQQILYSSWKKGQGLNIKVASAPYAWRVGLVGMKPGGARVIVAPPSSLGVAPNSKAAKAGPILYVVNVVSVS